LTDRLCEHVRLEFVHEFAQSAMFRTRSVTCDIFTEPSVAATRTFVGYS